MSEPTFYEAESRAKMALAAGAGAASAIPDDPFSPFLWAMIESNYRPEFIRFVS